MEDNSTLFSLSIDPVTKDNLSETAKWARFMAIVGFVFLGIMVLSGLMVSLTMSRFETLNGNGGLMGAAGSSVAVIYLIFAAIAFFPLLFTFRFASHMQGALNSNDQARLNASFQNLKVCFRYLGIITIISLALFALTFFVALAGLAIN
jgi:hypothetical protein